jgi:hypothetical protein
MRTAPVSEGRYGRNTEARRVTVPRCAATLSESAERSRFLARPQGTLNGSQLYHYRKSGFSSRLGCGTGDRTVGWCPRTCPENPSADVIHGTP